jgi:hypothetical protein
MSNLYKKFKNLIDGDKPKPEVETEIIPSEDESVVLTPFEKKLNVLYMGCYNVNPVNPIITTELGNVHNQSACINAGQEAKYKYVALQNGNECLATNNADFSAMSPVLRKNCNMVCDEASAGYCGGVLKNQIYATSIVHAVGNEHSESLINSVVPSPIPTSKELSKASAVTPAPKSAPPSTETKTETMSENIVPAEVVSEKESFRHLENFASHNREMKSISNNISQIDMVCQEPINKYNLFLSLLIVLLLAHILVGFIYKKNMIN